MQNFQTNILILKVTFSDLQGSGRKK